MQTIALFGGTFDPPHLGHLQIARAALASGKVEQVWLMPAKLPPHKTAAAPLAARRAMAQLLIAGEPDCKICDLEAQMPGKNYTIYTLQRLRELHPEWRFRLLIGADMALSFGTWRDAGEVLRSAPPLVAARPGYEFSADFGENLPAELMPDERRILRAGIFPAPLDDVSSSAIRARVAAADDYAGLMPAIAAYAREHNLYIPGAKW